MEHAPGSRGLAARTSGKTGPPSRASTAPDSGAASTGGDAMWRILAPGEATRPVQLAGRVRAPHGVHLRSHPAGPKDGPVLPFDTLVSAVRATENGWLYVVSLGDAIVGPTPLGGGFIESYHLATDPPEPTAHLHPVQPGDMLKDIAARYYGQNFTKGNDARLYVQAIYHANHGRDAVFRQTADLSVDRRALDTDDLFEAQRLWNQARVVAGQALWIPSDAFVQQLKSSGVIHHGSISRAAWNAASETVATYLDVLAYPAGLVVGALEGAFGAIFDLFEGMVELIELLWPIARALSGDVDTIMRFVRQLDQLWTRRDDILLAVASDFLDGWQAENPWDRGKFQGEFLGYVMMSAFIILATCGAGAAITATGRFGSVLRFVRMVDAVCDITTYVGPMVNATKLPGRLVDRAAEALGHTTPRRAGVASRIPDGHGSPGRHLDGPGTPGGHRNPLDDAGPYRDPRVDPDVPHRRLDDHEMAAAGELPAVSSWSDALDALRTGSTAIGKTLGSAREGHEILAHLARGDASALRKLGIDDFPPGADPSKREWALVEARDGFKVYVGRYDRVELPSDVRRLAHTHPNPDPSAGPTGATDLAIPEDSKGLAYDEILKNADNASKSGMTPSLFDIHAISDGSPHVIYTRYIHLGEGKITNPARGRSGRRVELHLSGAQVVRSHPRSREFWYKVDVTVQDSAGKALGTRTMYAKWVAQTKSGFVVFDKPAQLKRPAGSGWTDHG